MVLGNGCFFNANIMIKHSYVQSNKNKNKKPRAILSYSFKIIKEVFLKWLQTWQRSALFHYLQICKRKENKRTFNLPPHVTRGNFSQYSSFRKLRRFQCLLSKTTESVSIPNSQKHRLHSEGAQFKSWLCRFLAAWPSVTLGKGLDLTLPQFAHLEVEAVT